MRHIYGASRYKGLPTDEDILQWCQALNLCCEEIEAMVNYDIDVDGAEYSEDEVSAMKAPYGHAIIALQELLSRD